MERIYSLNLAAWLIWKTNYKPTIEKDIENNMYFCIFPQDGIISNAISLYKDYNNVLVCEDLREYLRIFKELKKQIKNLKITEGKVL